MHAATFSPLKLNHMKMQKFFLRRRRAAYAIGIGCAVYSLLFSSSIAQDSSARVEPTAEAGQTEAVFLSKTRQLTFDGVRAGEGYFSRDGKSMVFQSERDRG